MGKVKKIIKTCIAIVKLLYWIIRPKKKSNQTVAFLFRVSKWKREVLPAFLEEYELRFVPYNVKMLFLHYELKKYPSKVFIIWGYSIFDDKITAYAEKQGIDVYRIEDGFLRSKGLGSMHNLPFSLCLDKKGMYFDSRRPSDLEDILNNYSFDSNQELIRRAKDAIQSLNNLGISKYNHVDKKNAEEIYGQKRKKRILVVGQVEDDASIKYGANLDWTNNKLVELAKQENEDAEIIYKPHPDVLFGRRKFQSNPEDVKHIAKVIEEPLSLADSLNTIDHVYTITSLSGFEALLRGIPVTTVGAPFYSGWGLTDDRQPVTRRKRTLTVAEVFAGAYILYPRYRNPITKKPITLENTISILSEE
ncbi:capsular polysaccharide export protein, LipB/KpsS family [Paraliobacillus ryukyuensis]|uniref:capsular polysaccharide export protein, LipB/KpsS family n=1 Tax=Paraliobacillus ryukyuensis TaxID=200904 RepID=UPI0009A71004|nr:beta-3-deoxy-D-manno-oct-2-ulosonic acid transferase [Paraliobacillus ryukyuensis]